MAKLACILLLASQLYGGSVTIINGVYSNVNSAVRKYRVYYPAGTKKTQALPVVVYIHGGGWALGDLNDKTITPGTCSDDATIACWLADHGYVVFSIDYTLIKISEHGNDLAVTGASLVSAESHSFTSADIGSAILIQEGNSTRWHTGGYRIQAVSGGSALLDTSPGEVGANKGQYTLLQGSTLWPAQWQDCNCFLRFLATNLGVTLPGDQNDIFLMGHSAGAHLVSLAGLGGNDIFPTNCEHTSTSYKIRGIVAASPPTDLVTLYTETATAKSNVRNLLGCIPGYGSCDTIAASASVTTYVGPNLPPYISFSGGSDMTIPPENVQEAQTAFARLQPPVISRWVDLGPAFYHLLDLFYYVPCSAAPATGSEPSPCGSAGEFFSQASTFISDHLPATTRPDLP